MGNEFSTAPSPQNEIARLESLRHFRILDTAPEKDFDDLTLLASQICGTPVALVSLVDADRQWFKSRIGLQAEQTSRDIAFCAHAILRPEVMVVPDAALDERFASNPLVTSEPFIRFYAGVPLITGEGHALGTLCVADRTPRTLNPAQIEGLRALGRQVMNQMRLRRLVFDLENTIEQRGRTEEALRESEERYREVVENSQGFICTHDMAGVLLTVNDAAARLLGYAPAEMIGRSLSEFAPPPARRRFAGYLEALDRLSTHEGLLSLQAKDGQEHILMYRNVVSRRPGRPPVVLGHAVEVTDRYRSERALAELAAIVGSSDDAIIGKTLDGTIATWNSGAEKIYGYTAAEVQGRSISILIPPDRPDEVPQVLQTIREGGRVQHYETVRRTKDGRQIDVALTTSPIRDSAGRIIGASTIARDITEIRAEQRRLRAEHAVTGILAGTATLGEAIPGVLQAICRAMEWQAGVLWTPERDGQFLKCLDLWHEPLEDTVFDDETRRLRFAHGQGLPGTTWATAAPMWISNESQDRRFQSVRLTGHDNLNAALAFPVLWRDEVCAVLQFLSPVIREPDQRLLAMMGSLGSQIGQFIVRRRTEAALAEVNARLNAVLAAATEVSVIATDTSGVIVIFNSGAERMLGYAAEEVVGKQTPEIIHLRSEVEERGRNLSQEFGKPITGFDVFVEHARRGDRSVNEWTYVRKDGTQLTVDLAVTAVHDYRGELSGFLGVAIDITARKRAEEEQVRAKAAAEAANRAKSEFLANMSHEIRTPLNGVLGMAQLLEDTQLTPEQREYLGVIRTSAESLLTVINDILDFSKIEAGKLDFDLAPFRLHDKLQEITTAFRFRALQKQLALEYHIAPDVPHEVIGDAARLSQVIINLLSNAIKFTERGQVLLRVSLESQMADDVVLHFSVQDTGIGIPPEKQERVFRAFEQADTSTARRYGGTGLGLTISSTLVRMMHGRLWVESEADHGSTFHFTARFGLAQPQQRAATPGVVAQPAPPVSIRALRILLAEDNAVNQTVAVRLLEKQGHTVVVAPDGQRALAALQRETFDVVLMDVQMPDMDGFEAAAAIREWEKAAGGHVPIIAMTARAMKGDRERCLAAGMDGYVPKPIQVGALHETIARVAAATVAVSNPAVSWNRESSLARLMGDEELLAEVAALFLENAPRMLAAVRHAIDRGDSRALESAAHTLRSSSSTFEAADVMEAALKLEMAGHAGELAGTTECYARLESHFERLQSSLRSYYGEAT